MFVGNYLLQVSDLIRKCTIESQEVDLAYLQTGTGYFRMTGKNTLHLKENPKKLSEKYNPEKYSLNPKSTGGGGGCFPPPVRFLADSF